MVMIINDSDNDDDDHDDGGDGHGHGHVGSDDGDNGKEDNKGPDDNSFEVIHTCLI